MGNKQMVQKLNRYFASILTVVDTSSRPELQGQGAEVRVVAITEEKVLGKQKGDKYHRPDGLHARVLKEIVKALESGRLPEDWIMANVTPLFKNEGRQNTGIYRPVSLTVYIGKILESIIKDEIAEYLRVHGKIGQSQHGFKGRSCLTNLLEFFDEVKSKLDKGEPVDVIYSDFQKAFDMVLNRMLLNK
eukprot:g38898.t1